MSKVILGSARILDRGIEPPDAILAASREGLREIVRAGVLDRSTEATLSLADDGVALPANGARVGRFPFRKAAGARRATLEIRDRASGADSSRMALRPFAPSVPG